MKMYYEIMVLGLISLTAPWLARWAGYETTRKPFDLVGVGGIFFLLTTAFDLGVSLIPTLQVLMHGAMLVALVVGMILLAIAGVWGISGAFREPTHGLAGEHA
jgi:hypothetical protein